MLLELEAGTSAQYIAELARALQLTLLARQSFTLTGRTLLLLRLDGTLSVRDTLRLVQARYARVSTGQANFFYGFGQAQPPAPPAAAAQYVVPKLHLLEAHRITNGDDVLVAVIDSKIDGSHPDLAGVIADEYDALGTPGPAHMHGTGMAGAIAAHSKLVGVAPKVKLLAVRAFSGTADGAQGTTFNILKGLDWAASKNARIVNMSFAGPPDPMFRDMLAKAHARGIVLIAAVGNAGPRSPPLYPAADPDVIGVTATDAEDRAVAAGQSRAASRGGGARRASPGAGARCGLPGHHRHLGCRRPCQRRGRAAAGARSEAHARPGAQPADQIGAPYCGQQARRRRRRDRRARRGQFGEEISGIGKGGQGEKLVGAARFELTTPCPPDRCANRAALRPDRNGADYRDAPIAAQ